MKYEPFYYQKYAEDFILSHLYCGLFLDMGMGKTVITLSALQKVRFDIGKALIIAPLRPAKETWPAEIEKWDHLQDITYSLCIGSAKEREAALLKDADLYIINRENVPWLVERYGKDWPFDTVVIDELSSFKSAKSQRFRAMKKVRKKIRRIIGLTGTPASNGLIDLWPETTLLDMGQALGRTLTGFRETYFDPDKRNAHVIYSWKPKSGAEEAIYKKLEPFCVSMKSAEYLNLPEQVFSTREVRLSEASMNLYRTLERDMLLLYEDGDIDAGNAAVLTGKLLQLSGGACYDENGNVKILHEEKLQVLDDLVEEANGQPLLIFYAYKHEAERIMKRYEGVVDIREEQAVASWNQGKIPILLAHPASAGHGLNLQQGGHIIVWYGLPMSLELYQQANKRLHRPGQKETVLIHHLICTGTYEEHVLNYILASKEARQTALLDALKARIKERSYV